jgi:hypothetical protein
MRGVGNSYGFELVSLLGERIEQGARNSDHAAIDRCIAQYRDYLDRVQISYE